MKTDQADTDAATANVGVDTTQTISERKPREAQDAKGNDKTYDPALGLLARNFVDLFHASQTGCLDLNEVSQRLQVPKRRLYDITNILEGVGMIVKKSRNTVVWKGSVTSFDTIDASTTKVNLEKVRKTIESLHKEEALLDEWISRINKTTPENSQSVSSSDIVEAILYPVDQDLPQPSLSKDMLIDGMGHVRKSFIAIHAPYNATAIIPKPEGERTSRQLYVGTKYRMRGVLSETKAGDNAAASSTNSQSATQNKKHTTTSLKSQKATPSAGDIVLAYSLPVAFNETTQKLESIGSHPITALYANDPLERSSFGPDEGISDFFTDGEEVG